MCSVHKKIYCLNKLEYQNRDTESSRLFHSALKLEKSAISKVQKHNFLLLQKCQKNQFFAPQKSLKTTKNAILNFFSGAKIDFFCHF